MFKYSGVSLIKILAHVSMFSFTFWEQLLQIYFVNIRRDWNVSSSEFKVFPGCLNVYLEKLIIKRISIKKKTTHIELKTFSDWII